MDDVVKDAPDTAKKCLCYFCEEPIVLSLPSEKFMKAFSHDPFIASVKPEWRHVATGEVFCRSVATPSNWELS